MPRFHVEALIFATTELGVVEAPDRDAAERIALDTHGAPDLCPHCRLKLHELEIEHVMVDELAAAPAGMAA